MREFFYKRSDILVALLIIVIAAVVIYYRVSDIMAYPQTVKEGIVVQNPPAAQTDTNTGDATIEEETENADSTQTTESDDDALAGLQTQSESSGEDAAAALQPGQEVEFVIVSGDSSVSITENLYNAGLIADRQAFLSEIAAEEAETRLMTGTFTLQGGMSPAEIIQVITAS